MHRRRVGRQALLLNNSSILYAYFPYVSQIIDRFRKDKDTLQSINIYSEHRVYR